MAHIYPYAIGTKSDQKSYKRFWGVLAMFWSSKQITEWEEVVLGPQRTEILPNLMCLAPHVHRLWGKAHFALKPVKLSEDRKRLTVVFYWLGQGLYEQKDLRMPPTQVRNFDGATRGTRFVDCESLKLISSGDTLTFTTTDSEKFPLPSIALLEMQWLLNRLVAISGAANVSDEELDPDDPLSLAPPISVGDDTEEMREEETGKKK